MREAWDELRSRDVGSCLVAVGSGDWRELGRGELGRASESEDAERPLSSLALARPVERVYPDVSLDAALKQLASAGILPVVSRANPRQLLGTLTLQDVLRTYGVA